MRLVSPDPYGPPSPLVTRWADRRAPPGHVLDLGCGHGRHSLFLASRGWCVDALDHDPHALRALAQRARARVRAHRVDLATWTTTDAAYDLVLLFRVLYQLEDTARARVVRRARAQLAPGGDLLVVEPTTVLDSVRAQLGEPVEGSLRHGRWREGALTA